MRPKMIGRIHSLFIQFLLLLGVATFVACSSSAPKEELTDIIPASADAGTDVVPSADGGEVPTVGDAQAAAAPPAPDANSLGSVDIPKGPPEIEGTVAPPPPEPAPEAKVEAATAGTAADPLLEANNESAPPTPPTESAPPEIPAPSPPSSSGSLSGNVEEYHVQKGDTLMKIAYETYGDLYKWKMIYESNRDKIQDPNSIPSGTVLKLEKPSEPVTLEANGEKYLIKKGETLGTISNSVYGTPTKWKTIWKNNSKLIHDPNRIFAGFYLYYVPEEGGGSRQIGSVPQAGD